MMKINVSELQIDTKYNKPLYIADTKEIVLGPWVGVDNKLINFLKMAKIEVLETEGDKLSFSKEDIKKRVDARVKETLNDENIYLEYKKYSDVKEQIRVFHDDIVNIIASVFEKAKTTDIVDLELIKKISYEFLDIAKKHSDKLFSVSLLRNDVLFLFSAAVNITFYSLALGRALLLNDDELLNLSMGSLLHDIGMMKIPESIIYKQGQLSEQEYRVIKTAPIHSYQILQKNNFPIEVLNIVIQHHEQYDGLGYPKQLKGSQISKLARIVSITDNYVAQKSKRFYRDEKTSYEAMRSILSESQHKYDPMLLKKFLSIMAIYPVGSLVRLNTGFIALVTKANPNSPIRPELKLLADKNNTILREKKDIKLSDRKDLFILEAYNEQDLGLDLYAEI